MAILEVLKPRRPGEPAVVVVSSSELSAKSGELRREVELGAHISVVDGRSRRHVYWMTADPAGLARYLEVSGE